MMALQKPKLCRSALMTVFFLILSLLVSFSLPSLSADKNTEAHSEKKVQVPSEKKAEIPLEKKEISLEKSENSVETPSVLDKATEVAKETTEQVSQTLNETRFRRDKADYLALLNYSPVDLLIPSKQGITLGLIRDADKTWELEYLSGSISVPFIVEDLGKMSDTRISLIGRSYFGSNSFNFSYGLSYFDFLLHLGDKLLNRVSGGSYPSLDLIGVQSVGFNIGIGNRWTFKHNITLGIDWISWMQPLQITSKRSTFLDYATNEEDRDDVDKAITLISYMPRFAFLKLQLGILF